MFTQPESWAKGTCLDEKARVSSFSGCIFQVARPEPSLLKSKTVLDISGLWIRSQVFKIGEYIKVSVTFQPV